MRRPVEIAVTVLCVVCALLGLVLVVFLGPDSRRTTGPHTVDTDAIAIVTKPGLLSWTGLQLDVLVEVPVNRPVFVGLGNAVDVSAYVSGTKHLEVTDFKRPFDPTFTEVKGDEYLPGAPTATDWWIAADAGLGAARISTELPDETTSLAVIAVGTSQLSGLEVSYAWGLKGGFVKGIGLLLIGLGGLLAMRLLEQGAQIWAERRAVVWHTEEVEEVVYVWVDEFGAEHEVHPGDPDYEEFAAAERGEVMEQAEVGGEVAPAAGSRFGKLCGWVGERLPARGAMPEADSEPSGSLFGDSDPSLSGDTPDPDARGAESPPQSPDASPSEPEPEPEPEPEAEADEKHATYFWIDDDGVEHEMTAAEIAELDWDEYEITDEEDTK